MPAINVVEIEGLGKVIFKKSVRAKHLNIRVSTLLDVQVTMPSHLNLIEAKALVATKTAWIKRQLNKHKKIRQIHDADPPGLLPPMDRQNAKQLLTRRLNNLSKRHGLPFNRVFIKNQKTRWGSCSNKKNINLNFKLTRLPAELMDFVILHELVHTRHMDHGEGFWQTLLACEPRSRELALMMRQYHLAYL